MEEKALDVLNSLAGEVIVGAGVDEEGVGIHLYTQNGLILVIFLSEGNLTLGVVQTEQTIHH